MERMKTDKEGCGVGRRTGANQPDRTVCQPRIDEGISHAVLSPLLSVPSVYP